MQCLNMLIINVRGLWLVVWIDDRFGKNKENEKWSCCSDQNSFILGDFTLWGHAYYLVVPALNAMNCYCGSWLLWSFASVNIIDALQVLYLKVHWNRVSVARQSLNSLSKGNKSMYRD